MLYNTVYMYMLYVHMIKMDKYRVIESWETIDTTSGIRMPLYRTLFGSKPGGCIRVGSIWISKFQTGSQENLTLCISVVKLVISMVAIG